MTQWSHARCLEHIPALLRASAALDGRYKIDVTDYYLLIRLLQPMQLERYIISTAGFETGRWFDNNVYCILVELVSHYNPTILTIAEDYKIPPKTVERLLEESKQWVFIKKNSPKRALPTPKCQEIIDLLGVNKKW